MKQTNGKLTAFLFLLFLLSIRAANGSEYDGQQNLGTPVVLANAGDFGVESGNSIEVLHRYVKDERNGTEQGHHEISVLLESMAQIDKLSLTLDQRDSSLYPQSVTASLIVDNTVVYAGEFDPQKPITCCLE